MGREVSGKGGEWVSGEGGEWGGRWVRGKGVGEWG